MNHTYAEMSAALTAEIAAATPSMVNVEREQKIELLKDLRERILILGAMAFDGGFLQLSHEFGPLRGHVDAELKDCLLERELRGERG